MLRLFAIAERYWDSLHEVRDAKKSLTHFIQLINKWIYRLNFHTAKLSKKHYHSYKSTLIMPFDVKISFAMLTSTVIRNCLLMKSVLEKISTISIALYANI